MEQFVSGGLAVVSEIKVALRAAGKIRRELMSLLRLAEDQARRDPKQVEGYLEQAMDAVDDLNELDDQIVNVIDGALRAILMRPARGAGQRLAAVEGQIRDLSDRVARLDRAMRQPIEPSRKENA